MPLREWLRNGHNRTFTKFSIHETFVCYLKNKGKDYNKILNEMEEMNVGKKRTSSDCDLLIDEMFLQKSV